MFTLEQIEEIHRKLQLFGVKDKDLPILTEQLTGNEIITVVKDGRNVQLLISQLLDFNSFTPEQLESLRGPQGNDGKNAYQTWLSQGNVGTYDDYIAVLQLPALLAAETSTIRVNNKLNEADVVIEELNSLSNQTQESLSEMNSAKDLAYETVTHPPVIIDKYWHSWNHETNQYDTTYIKAEGDDAYETWLDAGNTGTLEDYLASLKGDTGNYGVVEFVINDNMELEQHTLIGDPLNFAIVNDDLVLTEGGETVILGKTGAVPTYIDITATRNEEDYNSIRDLVKSITDASYYKRYRIHIPAGRWFECDLNGKKYTELIGEGIGKTIIYNDTTSSNFTPSDYSFSQSAEQKLNSISRMTTHVIMATDDFIATDISFTVNSAKYPVHLDNPGYSEVKFTRCYFEITVGACFGIGINSGQRIEFNQCQFMDYGTDGTDGTGSSGYIHNWLNGTEKAIVTFNECHWLSNGGYAYIEDLGGYHDTIINFNSCTSSFSNPDIYYNVLLGFWKKEDGTNETNASLIPYTIKVNCQNTKVPVIKLSSPNKRENYRSYINCNWGDVSENTLIVSGSKTPAENAKELSAVYAIAKLMRPNGANLSSTNRVKILIKPGQYVFGSALNAAADPIFTIDTQYIDLLSYTGEADVCIDGFYVKANDVKIRGLKSYLLDINDDRWMLLLGTNLDKLVMENCHSSNYGFVTKTRIITDIVNGTFIKCTARMYSFGFKSTASGTFTDCKSKDQSFGALGTASGTFIRCKSDNVLCFGGYTGGTASGYFEDCKGGDYSFGGMNGSFTGKAVRCIAGVDSFGKNGDTGTLINCELLNTDNTYKTGLKIYNSINGTGIMINQ